MALEKMKRTTLTAKEAAEYLAIKPVTLRTWIKKDKGLPAHRVGKFWKFKRSELDDWIKSGKSAELEIE